MSEQIWDYSDNNNVFDSQIVLSNPLPQNGTVDVTPVSMDIAGVWGFTVPSIGFLTEVPGGAPSFELTTTNGQITGFDIGFNFTTQGTNTPTIYNVTISSQGDSYFEQTYGAGCAPNGCPVINATSAPGVWVDPPITQAPEISIGTGIGAVLLLLGVIAIIRDKLS